MKKICTFLLALMVVVSCLIISPTEANAASIVDRGTCGSNLTWTLDSKGTLTISGSGSMRNYTQDIHNFGSSDSIYRDIKKVVIKEGVTSIGNWAFYFCTNMQSVTIPSTVTRIGEGAFDNCESLTSVVIPNGVRMIPDFAFTDCAALETIVIPNSVQSFGQNVFDDCSALRYCIIPEGVTEISYGMFWGCSSLEYVQLPKTVTEIDTFAFYECGSLYDIYYTGTYSQFYNIDVNSYNTQLDRATIHYSTKAPCETHVFGEYTTTSSKHSRTCENCGYVESASHSWKKTTKEATCEGTGSETKTCKACAKKVVTKKEALGHNWKKGECTRCGGEKVKVTKQPTSKYVAVGKTAKVSIKATGDGLTYQWFVKDPGSSKYTKSSVTKSAYSVKITTENAGRKVYCVVTDKYGNTEQSKTVIVGATATIVEQPTNVSAKKGKVAKTSVVAIGNDLTYKWYIKNPGAKKFTKSSVITATYSCKMSASTNGRKVYCVVTDKFGNSVTSDIVTLYVGNPLKINKQPVNVVAAKGKTAKVTVSATGDGLTYQWYIKNPSAKKFAKSSVTSATYSCKMSASNNGRQVYCVITDKYGNSVKTDTVTCYMGKTVKLTKQPADVNAAKGKTAKVTVSATGDGLTYKWYIKNPGAKKFAKSSVTTATYSCKMSASNDGRQIYCVITDKYGNSVTTNVVTLQMTNSLTIKKQPVDVSALEGETARVTVSATGEGLTYKWYYKNAGDDNFALASAYKSKNYSITMNTERSGRQVYCVITDKYGNSVTTETVTLSIGRTVEITQQPSNVTVASGGTAKVTVSAIGDGLTYQWYYKDSDDSFYTTTLAGTSNSYSVTMSSSVNGRKVYCVVKDQYGNFVFSNTVTLSMSQTSSQGTFSGTWRSSYHIPSGGSATTMTSWSLYTYSDGDISIWTHDGENYRFEMYYAYSSNGNKFYYDVYDRGAKMCLAHTADDDMYLMLNSGTIVFSRS